MPFGVDLDPARIRHARELHPRCPAHFQIADIFSADVAWPCDVEYRLVLLSLRRLLEVPTEQVARLRGNVSKWPLLVYLYEEAAHSDDLRTLGVRAGLDVASVREDARVALASWR